MKHFDNLKVIYMSLVYLLIIVRYENNLSPKIEDESI